eukprot:CAMPEP_0197825350 /NCGR_PEP_ID=MMETSP1437-20131217/2452_1 /TAXON_ID=49252 ORGANISM="Eucampia antarctica, Strain CCMP1452" /NCGR_SAMPLE_ID=MMETSP1437 /ASSEMBLY_ACC=CAM_ASM_001096 /LENGTH=226 /DNA_ID=CAMNT_0043425317 /DNA_START=35 /DNA_END=715 /DNA_ORIENTATION=+
MGGVFSSSHKSHKEKKSTPAQSGSVTNIDRSVLDLKNSRDRLTRYKTKLDKDNEKLFTRAKTLNTEGKKSAALNLLKLRKYKIKEAERVESQLLTVFQMVEQIQSKENEMEVMTAMKSGKNALNKLHDEMSIDDVLQLMDEVQEGNEVENEINEIIGQGAADALTSEEESQVEAELAALEKELSGEPVHETETIDLPNVPSSKLPEIEKVPAKVVQKVQTPEAVPS